MAITTTNISASSKSATSRIHNNIGSDEGRHNLNNMLNSTTDGNIDDYAMNSIGDGDDITSGDLIDSDTNNNNNENNDKIEDNGQENNDKNKKITDEIEGVNTDGDSAISKEQHSDVIEMANTTTSIGNAKTSLITAATGHTNNHISSSTRHKVPLNSNPYHNTNNNHRENNHYNNHHYYGNHHHHQNHNQNHSHHSKHSYNNNVAKHKTTPLTWSSYNTTNVKNINNNTIMNNKDSSQNQASNVPTTQPNANHPSQPIGPPYFVELHVNAGQCVSLQLLDGREQIVSGPATITMVSQQQTPPVPIPVQVSVTDKSIQPDHLADQDVSRDN